MTAQQLKNSILQMAVQGKLVPQDPSDEPASVLLERIKAEKQELIKAGKIKKDKKPSEIFRGASRNIPYTFCEQIGKEIRDISDEIPFDIPESWEWVRCSTIGTIIRGSGIKRTETIESGMPCIRYGELYTTYNNSFSKTVSFVPQNLFEQCKHIRYGDVLFTLTGENKPDIAKTVAYLGNEIVAVGGDLAYWTQHGMNPLYLVYLMASPYVINKKVSLATGDIIVHISGDKIGSILIPIPPIAEQERIVTKISELEPLINEYSKKEQSASALNTTFPEALKKSILQEAVQGKLVPQNPSDEPASVLLERIRAEKQKLIKEGKIKKSKSESIIVTRDKIPYEIIDGKERCIADEVPFELPEGWCWCRLSSLGITQTGNTPSKSNPDNFGSYIPFIGPGDIVDGIINYSNQGLSKQGKERGRICSANSIVQVCIGGSIGKAAITDREISFNQQLNTITTIFCNYKYVFYSMTSDYFVSYIKTNAGGTATPIINRGLWDSILIPVPPLAEQHRVVAKIEELMKYCEKL